MPFSIWISSFFPFLSFFFTDNTNLTIFLFLVFGLTLIFTKIRQFNLFSYFVCFYNLITCKIVNYYKPPGNSPFSGILALVKNNFITLIDHFFRKHTAFDAFYTILVKLNLTG